jgi:hypothetical protein
MSELDKYSDLQIVDAIGTAVREREFDVIPGLVKLLAIKNPSLAEWMLDVLRDTGRDGEVVE